MGYRTCAGDLWVGCGVALTTGVEGGEHGQAASQHPGGWVYPNQGINRDPTRAHFVKYRELFENIRITTINRDPIKVYFEKCKGGKCISLDHDPS
jgi:hypothetical protein